jgi:hypothetical protein
MMNSAITYQSAAQMHADAIREALRNPPPTLPVREPGERSARRGPLLTFLRRRPLRPALSL